MGLETDAFVWFLGASVVCILMPGPAVIYVLANGLGRGAASSIAAACGTTAGVSVHLAAAIAGLAAVLHASALLFSAVKLIGAAYLLFLAWRTIRSRDAILPAGVSTEISWRRIFWTGFAVNILNPKLSIFFLAFLPQFVSPTAGSAPLTMLLLGALFMAMTVALFIGYGLFAARLRDLLLTRPGVAVAVRWTFGAMFAGLGLRLALAER